MSFLPIKIGMSHFPIYSRLLTLLTVQYQQQSLSLSPSIGMERKTTPHAPNLGAKVRTIYHHHWFSVCSLSSILFLSSRFFVCSESRKRKSSTCFPPEQSPLIAWSNTISSVVPIWIGNWGTLLWVGLFYLFLLIDFSYWYWSWYYVLFFPYVCLTDVGLWHWGRIGNNIMML